MTKKTRKIILLICAILFFIITPYVVLFSLGYRVDFQKLKIVATGGIYIKVFPKEVTITIDSKTSDKTSIFSNSFFMQNLLPGEHNVGIQKDGYYDYQKNLDVKENEVTKLEHVILFKKNISFEIVTDKTKSPFNQQTLLDKYIIKNNNLYYNNINSQSQINVPIIKNIITYKASGNNIIWLGLDGFLYSSDITGKNTEKLSQVALKINKKNSYKLTIFSQNTFLKENNDLLLLNQNTKSFQDFYNPVEDIKTSPDGQKLLYYNDHEILFSDITQNNPDKIFLNRFSEKISDCQWLNSDYIVFTVGGKINISEIDNRDNVNTIELPSKVNVSIEIKEPQIIFNQQDKRLYVLSQGVVLSSEELIP